MLDNEEKTEQTGDQPTWVNAGLKPQIVTDLQAVRNQMVEQMRGWAADQVQRFERLAEAMRR